MLKYSILSFIEIDMNLNVLHQPQEGKNNNVNIDFKIIVSLKNEK